MEQSLRPYYEEILDDLVALEQAIQNAIQYQRSNTGFIPGISHSAAYHGSTKKLESLSADLGNIHQMVLSQYDQVLEEHL